MWGGQQRSLEENVEQGLAAGSCGPGMVSPSSLLQCTLRKAAAGEHVSGGRGRSHGDVITVLGSLICGGNSAFHG